MAKAITKRGPGRPKKLSDGDLKRIKVALKKRGARVVHVASDFKISISTLRRNVPDYAAFLRA